MIHFARRAALGCAALCLSAPVALPQAHAQAVFPVTFDATATALTGSERAAITSHVQEAGRRWAKLLVLAGAPSIEVEIGVANISTANGSSTTSAAVATINGRTIYAQGMAAELVNGIDINGVQPDVHINIGLDYLRNQIWFDPDPAARNAPMPANRVDALSVFLHELGHALVYNGWADNTTGVPPDTYESTFDLWITPGAPSVFSGPRAVASWGQAPDLTTGNNKHWGNSSLRVLPLPARAQPTQWRAGRPVPAPAAVPPTAPPAAQRPAAIAAGSLILQLMNGVVFYAQHRYDISSLDIAVLEDTGILLDRVFSNGFEAPSP